jgi:2-polyprenyl-3-methyl-5-hydroxy-6-metoxy-1,4-benzoquinol methylase
MDRWSQHWADFPKKFGEKEFLKQVGKSVGGKEIGREQFNALIESLITNLDVQKSDSVLDLCCGNGLITGKIAPLSREIVGIDQSECLINIAKQYNSATNSTYLCSSILDIESSNYGKFSKIYMYEALQHFEDSQFVDILNLLGQVSAPNATILLASVPDKNLLWEFYNTDERRDDYYKRRAAGNEAIGTWWERSYLKKAAQDRGYTVGFLNQNSLLHTAHYRFDLLLKHP